MPSASYLPPARTDARYTDIRKYRPPFSKSFTKTAGCQLCVLLNIHVCKKKLVGNMFSYGCYTKIISALQDGLCTASRWSKHKIKVRARLLLACSTQ